MITNKRIWVTGASSGIGRSLAEELLNLGNTVVLSARTTESLKDLAKPYGDKALILPLDVTNKTSLEHAKTELTNQLGALDIAILNAGTCEYIDASDFDGDLFERVINVNLTGFARCVEISLPLLRNAKNAQLVGMSSTVAHAPLPRAEAYGASKAGVQYLMESLRADLSGEDIDVSVIYPGFVKTPLTDKNDFPMPMMVSVEESTRQIVKGISKRSKSIYYPFAFSVLIRLLGALPIWLRNALSQRMKTDGNG